MKVPESVVARVFNLDLASLLASTACKSAYEQVRGGRVAGLPLLKYFLCDRCQIVQMMLDGMTTLISWSCLHISF
jgi:hypothetical protein